MLDNKKLTIELARGASPIYRASFDIFDLAVHTETIRTVNFIHVADDKKAAKDNYPNNTTIQSQIQNICLAYSTNIYTCCRIYSTRRLL